MNLNNDKNLKFFYKAKKVEIHAITKIGSLKDLDQWIDSL